MEKLALVKESKNIGSIKKYKVIISFILVILLLSSSFYFHKAKRKKEITYIKTEVRTLVDLLKENQSNFDIIHQMIKSVDKIESNFIYDEKYFVDIILKMCNFEIKKAKQNKDEADKIFDNIKSFKSNDERIKKI